MADKAGYVDAIDGSAILANKLGQTVEIYHIPSKYSVIFKAMMTLDFRTSVWKNGPTSNLSKYKSCHVYGV